RRLKAGSTPTLESLARFDIRFRWLIVGVWIVGAIAAPRLLPSLASLSQSNNAQFLPSSSPSQHAATLAAPFQTANAWATALSMQLRGPLPRAAAGDASADSTGSSFCVCSVVFVAGWFFVGGAPGLGRRVPCLAAVLTLVLAGPLIADGGRAGLPVSIATPT